MAKLGFFTAKTEKKKNKKTANFLKFHVVRRSKTARQGPAEVPRGSVIAGGLPCPPASFLCLVLIVSYRIVSHRIVAQLNPAGESSPVFACHMLVVPTSYVTLRYVRGVGLMGQGNWWSHVSWIRPSTPRLFFTHGSRAGQAVRQAVKQ